jgi:hypothetical protein
MRTFDWSTTPLGLVEGWPQSLKTGVCFTTTFPYPTRLLKEEAHAPRTDSYRGR